MPTPIRLFLLDGPALCRRSLAALLKRRPTLQVVGEAATAEEALPQLRALRPDLVVLEPEVSGGGSELIARLRQELPDCAVLVLTVRREPAAAGPLLHAGARGYLLKECGPDDLVTAIQQVSAGEFVLAPAVARSLLEKAAGETVRPSENPSRLTDREREVLGLVVQGLTNAQIAQMLCITEHTVKAHLVKLLSKLGLDNRVQLVAYALREGLSPPSSEQT